MLHDPAFDGGVFSATLPGGRSGARLTLRGDGLEAETPDGTRFQLPYAQCRLERGGASGRMWFCRTPDRSLTLFSEAKGFAEALRNAARRELGDAIDAIEVRNRAGSKRTAVWSLIGLLALAIFGVGGYYAIRQLGRASVTVLPISVDEKLGALAIENMSMEGRPLEDPVVTKAITAIVDRLSPYSQIKDADGRFTYRVRVMDAGIVNAFALPGGHIVVYTGLLRAAKSPEQVAGVLAHEMAHVTRRHGMKRIAQSIGVVAAIQLLFGDVSGVLAVALELLREGTINSYGREQEHEADMDGVATLHGAQVDARALADFFALLQEKHAGLPTLPSWLGTHPDLSARIQDVRQEATRLGATTGKPFDVSWDEVRRAAGAAPEATPEAAPEATE